MTITTARLNEALGEARVAVRTQAAALEAAAVTLKNRFEATTKSKLGRDLSAINGFKPVSQSADHPTDLAPGDAVCFMTKDVPGLVELVEDMATASATAAAELEAIAGTSEAGSNGFLKEVASSNTPRAVKDALVEVTTKTAAELDGVLKTLTSPEFQAELKNTMAKGLEAAKAMGEALKEDADDFLKALKAQQGSGSPNVLEAITLKADKSVFRDLSNMVNGTFSQLDLDALTTKISSGELNAFKEVANTISSGSSLDFSVIEDRVNSLSTSVAGTLETPDLTDAIGGSTSSDEIIGAGTNTWQDENTTVASQQEIRATPDVISQRQEAVAQNDPGPANTEVITSADKGSTTNIKNVKPVISSPTTKKYGFTFITSEEELEAELRSVSREITEVVVHWTGTFLNQDIGSEEVHDWHTQRGFSGCGYHYVIRKDGRIQRGRPINKVGAHAKDNGHNNRSIGISFVAGYNCMSGTPNRGNYVNSGSINEKQFLAFDQFMKNFYKVYPGGQAFGHVDTDDKGKQDPGFDVETYVNNKFGKENLAFGVEAPLTRKQIAIGV